MQNLMMQSLEWTYNMGSLNRKFLIHVKIQISNNINLFQLIQLNAYTFKCNKDRNMKKDFPEQASVLSFFIIYSKFSLTN